MMNLEFDYHENDDGEWYWAIISEDNIIARSTDPQEHEAYCVAQIKAVLNLIRNSNDNIPVTNRLTRRNFFL